MKSLKNGAISAMDTLSDAAGSATDRIQLKKMADEFDTLGTRLAGSFDIGEYQRRMNLMQAQIEQALADQDELF